MGSSARGDLRRGELSETPLDTTDETTGLIAAVRAIDGCAEAYGEPRCLLKAPESGSRAC